MQFERKSYLEALKKRMWNGQVKVITGIRRSGKSYLLKTLFREWLIRERNVSADDICVIELDDVANLNCRNPIYLGETVKKWRASRPLNTDCYLFIDEIQLCEAVENPYLPDGGKVTFYDALNGFLHIAGLDVYVTGSNSKMLSKDILTEFRGRGDEIRMHPLSFSEYYEAMGGDKRTALDRYMRFGGMPFAVLRPDDASRENYLKGIFDEVYLKDIIERRHVTKVEVLNQVTDFLCSGIGSLTNPTNIANALQAAHKERVSRPTIVSYVEHLMDAFLFSEARRYDIKGRSYFDYPSKYYCEDVGLRNARIGFRQQEVTHIMENVIYNELCNRGYAIDVGVVYSRQLNANGNSIRIPREIDFVVNKMDKRVYVQSAFAIPENDEEKRQSELKPFSLTGDSFAKVVVRRDVGMRWYDENGVLNIGLEDFLLDPLSI